MFRAFTAMLESPSGEGTAGVPFRDATGRRPSSWRAAERAWEEVIVLDRRVAGILCVLAAVLLSAAALGKSKTALDIKAGPTGMSEEEKAIQPDPARRIEHGVILLEEYERNENLGSDNRYGFHMRAKILSPEARSMGDIEIPHDMNRGDLYDWWGRTILPDGTVLELKREELYEQIVADTGTRRVKTLKGALRGIVPGCVIDYGYIYAGTGGIILEKRILIQRSWPVQRFSIRWVPFEGRVSSFRLTHAEGLKVEAKRESGSVLVSGSDIPPFVSEPYMPPADEIQPAVTFYYIDPERDVKHFWSEEGQRLETRAKDFSALDAKLIQETIDGMKIPPGVDLEKKLRIAYDWILDNIRNLSLRSREEIDADAAADKKTKKERATLELARDVLAQKEGYGMQISHLFLAMARALGAEAHVVEVPDRSENYWDSGRLTADQFEGRFIVVGAPGAPREKSWVVDPGGGLPWGELPWWLTDVKGLLGTAEAAENFYVPPIDASQNAFESKVEMSFSAEDAVSIKWTIVAHGQSGTSERRHLKSLPLTSRQKRLEELCGSSDRLEVSKATVGNLDKPRVPLEIRCEGTLSISGLTEETGTYEFTPDGPWNGGIPIFTEPKRVHPIVFKYARIDATTIDVTAPEGFTPKGDTPSAQLGGGVCEYTYSATTTATGYRVQRRFKLSATGIAIESYEPLRRVLGHAKEVDRTRLVFERAGGGP
jgi:hypothetical protein